jgi:hypothetical protein
MNGSCLLYFFGGVSAMCMPIMFAIGFDSVSKMMVMSPCSFGCAFGEFHVHSVGLQFVCSNCTS